MVKLTKLFAYVATCSLLYSMSSCLAPAENNGDAEELIESKVSNISASVIVGSPWETTRASEEVVPLPIRYYLFSESGECVGTQTVEDTSVSAEFNVPKGVYTLYALCGELANAPTQSDVSEEILYVLATTNDICLGNEKVTVGGYGLMYPVQISVSHVFSMVSLSLIGVPESVEEICAEISDLYSSVKLTGEYGGTNAITTYLEPDELTSTNWNLPLMYVYPSAGTTMPITLTIHSNDGTTQTIQTTTEYVAKEGVKVFLSAGFQSLSSVTTGAVVIGNGWTETSGTVDFWGGNSSNVGNDSESSGNDTENQTEGSVQTQNKEQIESSISGYVVGEQFENTQTIILSVKENENSVDLLLVGSYLLYGTSTTIPSRLSSYGQNVGLDDSSEANSWSIPTFQDMTLLRTAFGLSELSAKINAVYGTQQMEIKSSTGFLLTNNQYYNYSSNSASLVNISSQYYCLPVISITRSK